MTTEEKYAFPAKSSNDPVAAKQAVLDKSEQLFDVIFRDSRAQMDRDVYIARRAQEFSEEIIEFTDDVFALSSSTKDIDLYSSCINTIENWRYFLSSNNINLPNHIYSLRNDLDSGNVQQNGVSSFNRLVSERFSNRGRIITGIATRDAIDKTVPILVERTKRDRRTGKYVRHAKKYLIHDEFNVATAGAAVVALETRPLSKRKSFRLLYSTPANV
ncbi:small ribosomal subunit protein uS17 [Devosia sp. CAU 1758]